MFQQSWYSLLLIRIFPNKKDVKTDIANSDQERKKKKTQNDESQNHEKKYVVWTKYIQSYA